jgi:hypothetical protein
MAHRPPSGPGLTHPASSSHLVRLLSLYECSVRGKGLSILQHTTLTMDRHPCPKRDSNPQSHQANGRRLTPWTVRSLGPVLLHVVKWNLLCSVLVINSYGRFRLQSRVGRGVGYRDFCSSMAPFFLNPAVLPCFNYIQTIFNNINLTLSVIVWSCSLSQPQFAPFVSSCAQLPRRRSVDIIYGLLFITFPKFK